MKLLEKINWERIAQLPENELQRLYHGRGFQHLETSHINIEWLSPVILIILYKEESLDDLTLLSTQLLHKMQSINFGVKSIQVQYRCRDHAPTQLLWGEVVQDLVGIENGLKYTLNLGRNQNYGLFLDMKNGRNWLRENAQDKSILNLFSYTCGFSSVAIEGGAKRVINLDMSKAALAVGRDNHRLNGHDLSKVKYLGHDLFKSWGKLKRLGPYDIVIADPPSLQKGSINIERDYPKIMRRLPELLNTGGLALLCLNSPDLDFAFLERTLAEQCPEAKIIKRIEPEAHFININSERSLKCLLISL
ncbi:S-adenosylmethionine-dependent methyltransferase [Psychromonas sp. CNPT3]|uniref:class I SAM-dependent methyltransferase n=1 Tax=Psychromonas sp. CNPT3 TaxID=314282 RepID=UPI00006E7645|nr:class I SAM-dependent methyltransferase [Psychromonas sp. CNPT3]AGH80333.1 S-adenosylmethionine-dependent methyltransferase [Psychromonas sp. CNPT3]